MLVASMNHIEITKEIKKDQQKLLATTILRLGAEYDRERKKLKIDKTRTYTRDYTIKTASKNTWLIMLRKTPSKEKYSKTEDLQITCVTCFHDGQRLWVFNCTNIETLAVYTGHFFNRYNERLHLNLSKPIDIIKHFFKYNSYISRTSVTNKEFLYIGFCRDGIVFGEFLSDLTWFVHKTFVSRDLLRPDQDEAEKELLTAMHSEVVKGMRAWDSTINQPRIRKDELISINGHSMD